MLKDANLSQDCASLFFSHSCMNTQLKEEFLRLGEFSQVASPFSRQQEGVYIGFSTRYGRWEGIFLSRLIQKHSRYIGVSDTSEYSDNASECFDSRSDRWVRTSDGPSDLHRRLRPDPPIHQCRSTEPCRSVRRTFR